MYQASVGFKFKTRTESFGSLKSLARRSSIIDVAKEYVLDKMEDDQGKVALLTVNSGLSTKKSKNESLLSIVNRNVVFIVIIEKVYHDKTLLVNKTFFAVFNQRQVSTDEDE